MVSIAESFYYRIFERKWRMGEAFRGPSPCMPFSVSNKQKKHPTRSHPSPDARDHWFSAFESRARAQARRPYLYVARGRLAWCLLCPPRTSPCIMGELLAARPAQPNVFQKKHCVFSLCNNKILLFTDLSMAGLPAELKHITQRRKRKQP